MSIVIYGRRTSLDGGLFHDIYRYTIFYAIVLMVHITLSPYFNQGGPVYPEDGSETSTCRRTWWRNLLYINNFFDLADSCMPVGNRLKIPSIEKKSFLYLDHMVPGSEHAIPLDCTSISLSCFLVKHLQNSILHSR